MRKISREKTKYPKIKKFLKEKVGIIDPVKQAFEIDKLIRFVVLLNEMETENNKLKQSKL